jgi:hypothetical protein
MLFIKKLMIGGMDTSISETSTGSSKTTVKKLVRKIVLQLSAD